MSEIRIAEKYRFLPPLVFGIVSLAFALPLLLKWHYIGPRDWELFTTMAAVPVRTVLEYHQFPFWNPYIGGGNILFAHPEVAVLSPFFPLLLIFGAVGGLKLQVLVAYFLGFWGSYLLAKRLGLSGAASYLVSISYFGSSYFALHFGAGHIPFTHFCFLPWVVFFVLKADDNHKYLFGGIVAMALIILGNGAAIPFLYTAFFTGLFALLYSIEKRHFRYIKYYLVIMLGGVLIAAVKFLPMYLELSQFPWEGRPDDVTSVGMLYDIFFSFDQHIFRQWPSGQNWPWHEYGAFIPHAVALIAIAGLAFNFRRTRLWLIIGAFFLLFGLGHISDFSLWNLFMQLPGFASIRAPARAFQFVVLAVAIIGGFGLDSLVERMKPRLPAVSYLAPILVVLVTLTVFMINLPSLKTIAYKLPTPVKTNADFRQEIGGVNDIYYQFQRNRGSLLAPWLSAYKESRGLVTADNQVMMEYAVGGTLEILSRSYTPNRVEYEIKPLEPGSLVFGIGYNEGWFAADGRRVFERHGLVTTGYDLSDRKIVLEYRPPGFYTGLIISALSLVLLLVVFFNGKIGARLKTVLE